MSATAKILEAYDGWRASNPLRRFRERENVSQTTVAGVCDVPQPYVTYWEQGLRQPGEDVFATLAKLMGVSVTRLKRDWDGWLEARPS